MSTLVWNRPFGLFAPKNVAAPKKFAAPLSARRKLIRHLAALRFSAALGLSVGRDGGKSFCFARSRAGSRGHQLVAEALRKGSCEFLLYELLAWVVMPNHVHVVWKPLRPLPEITRWIKGSTARAANLLLGRTGKPFWQYESYDHCIRSDAALGRIIRYVERNPVAAGLVEEPEHWLWSSAALRSTGQKAYSTQSPLLDQLSEM